QRLDRIQSRRAHRRVKTEKQADDRGDADAERHRPDFDGRGNRRQVRDDDRDDDPEDRADHAAEHRQDDRLSQHLRRDVGSPRALRKPISRVRSVTAISMMFMITMPPTTSDSPTTPTSTAKMPLVALWYRSRIVSDVNMPKLSACFGRRRRAERSAEIASSM